MEIKRKKISLFQDFGLIEYETIDFNLDIGLRFKNVYERRKNIKDRNLEESWVREEVRRHLYIYYLEEENRELPWLGHFEERKDHSCR